MDSFRAIFKIVLHVTNLLTFTLISLIIRLFVRDFRKRRAIQVRMVVFFAKISLRVMNVHLVLKGQRDFTRSNYLLVSNHTGFVDIISIASTFPSLFITSLDMKGTPGLGVLTEMAGCLYVNRRNRSNIQQEILNIRDVLKEGFNVVLFPEAAAMSGEKIYPFKKTLLTAVAGTDIEILPAVVNFTKVNGEPMSHKWRDALFWYGDLSFLSVAWKCHSLRSVEVEIEFLEPLACPTEDLRREVAAKAQGMIEARYIPIPFPSNALPTV
jgi:1-acyl-sn-glycerol-3-phosphate acyltransferase